MTRVVIIDDEPLARNLVREYLQHKTGIEICEECGDGFEGIKAINQYQPDLIFLDIQMPKISGFEMLELLEKPPAVIFTTAFDEFAIKAFDKNATDYLLKPFTRERFDKALEKYFQSGQAAPVQQVIDEAAAAPLQQNRIVVKEGTKIKIIPVSKVQYLEAADDYVKIFTGEGSFLKNRTMTFYETSLSEFHFVRIHRSYIVNTQLITRIDAFEKDGHIVRLSNGVELPVSKTGYARLKSSLGF